MTLNDARSQVVKMNARFLESGLAVAVNPAIAFPIGDRVRLSWPGAKEAHGIFSREIYATISEYRRFFFGNHYSCLLNDGALIQVTYEFKNNEMLAHRLCYYPCPLALPSSADASDWDRWNDLLERELFSQLDSLQVFEQDDSNSVAVSSPSLLRLRSPIRFDYDLENDAENEPLSHVHVSDASARIPVHAPLSLGQFVCFVVSQFYSSHSAMLCDFGLHYLDRCIRNSEEASLHFDWRRQA